MNKIIKNISLCAGAVAVSMAIGSAARAATIDVNADITTSQTWTKDNVYVLKKVIYVTDGATLKIEAGTVVRGVPPSAPGAGDPGALAITRGAKIIAIGRPDLPIVFTDQYDDNVPGMTPAPGSSYATYSKITEKWGGILVMGRCFIANGTLTGGPNPGRTFQMEGLIADGTKGLYGGSDDDDDSGALAFLSLRYGGAGLAINNEINGLTMGCVGRSTHLSHIEVVNNVDDGIEMFGGTVSCKYAIMKGIGDDGYDTDEGYRGNIQFVANLQGDAGGNSVGSGISDRGFEMDGGNGPDGSQPYALWTIYNATIVGKGQDNGDGPSAKYAKQDANIGMVMRDNAGVQVFNSIIMDTGGPAVLISAEGTGINSKQRYTTAYNDWSFHDSASNGLAAAYFYSAANPGTGQTEAWQAHFADNVVWRIGTKLTVPASGDSSAVGFPWAACSINEVNASRDDTAANASEGPNPFNENLRAGFIGTNWNNIVAASMPIVSMSRVSSSSVADGKMLNIATIDPRATGDALTNTRTAPQDGFFTPVSFKGAFGPNANWAKGWTVLDAMNVITSPSVTPPSVSYSFDATNVTLSFPTVAGMIYAIEGSMDGIRYTPIQVHTGTGATHTFSEARVAGMVYRVVLF